MATTTLTITPGSSHRNAGQAASQASLVGQHHSLQQANASSPTASALQSPPSPVSRPASPSSPTSVSSASNLPTAPIVRVYSTRFRRFWEIVQTIVALVAIAFTIASFVRDYLDITKDRDPPPRRNHGSSKTTFGSVAILSEPASPPPGMAKRALHERSVPHHLELADYILYALLTFVVIATIMLPFAVDKFFGQSREEQPDTCRGEPSSTSIGEQHEVHTDPSDSPSNQPSREDERPSPTPRGNKLVTIMICALLVSPIVFGSTLVFLTLLSVYTVAKFHEIIAAAAAYCVFLIMYREFGH